MLLSTPRGLAEHMLRCVLTALFLHAALHWAASRGREQMVEYLLANKADATIVTEDSWSPVHDAARAGSEKCLRMLKEAGANMVLKTGNGSTPLHYAAQYDKIDVVKYLLNLDSDSAEGTGIVDVANSTGQVNVRCFFAVAGQRQMY